MERVKVYCQKSSIHGLNYATNENYSIWSRLLWTICLLLSATCTCYIFKGSYESYSNHPINFATETTYLHWNTSFLAVSICEVWYTNKLWDRLDQYSPQGKSNLEAFLSDTVFFTGQCYSCHKIDECSDCTRFLNLTLSPLLFRLKCNEIFKKCIWNDISFNCCEQFLPLETEYGVCFTVNSLHTTALAKSPKIAMVSNRISGPGHLQLYTTLEDLVVSLHAPEDVQFINQDPILRETVINKKKIEIRFSTTEIDNDEGVRDVNVKQRGCLYPDEVPNYLKAYKYYSYSTCVVQCRINNHIEFCNCTHHLMPNIYKSRYCNVSQLGCLSDNYEILNRIRPTKTGTLGIHCECVPSCQEPEYKIILKSLRALKKNEPRFDIKMQFLPSQKYKRSVVRSNLDLIVSIGGNLGLFFGASVLSLVEIIYFCCIRKLGKHKLSYN